LTQKQYFWREKLDAKNIFLAEKIGAKTSTFGGEKMI
jgi:hypothetical protein